MQTRALGKFGPRVSAIGLGCMGMSEFYGLPSEAEAVAAIHRALDLGINFLDTADVYGSGTNERLVGNGIRDRRDKAILATKCGIVRGSESATLTVNGRPEYVLSACEASLRRLRLYYIDLYYLHRVDPRVPIEETIGAMADLVRAGKVRHIGLSEASVETIRRAHAVHPITALQTEYSLWTRDAEQDVLPACRELGIGFVAYSPLGRGILTGAIRRTEDLAPGDFRRLIPRFQGENLRQNLKLVEVVTRMAEEKNCTPAQLALAWVLHKGEDIVPIPGTKRIRHVEENVAAIEVPLSADEVSRLEREIPKQAVAGSRYPDEGMSLVGR